MSREALEARVKELERHVLCTECNHLCGDHFEADGPCYGGRKPEMGPDEGEWCNCSGFHSEVSK